MDCGDERVSAPSKEREKLICGSKFGKNHTTWQKGRHFGGSGTCKGVPHKKRKHMSQFERFVTEGSDKAGELAKAGAKLDEGFMAEARAKTMQQEREEVYAVW